MIAAANADPLSLAATAGGQPAMLATNHPSFILSTDNATVAAIAQSSLPAPGFITVSAETVTTSPACHSPSRNRIHLAVPDNSAAGRSHALSLLAKAIRTKAAAQSFLIETSCQNALKLPRPELAHQLDLIAEASRIKPLSFILAPDSSQELPPATAMVPVTSYSLRSCPPERDCKLCNLHDTLAEQHAISLDTALHDLLKFGAELKSKGFIKHSPPISVFRAPEESVPVDIDAIPLSLRNEVQAWFDNHATNPPSARPTTRSPLYEYDEQGGILPRWTTPPSRKVYSRTAPGSQQRFVTYKEMLKDLVYDDIETIPIELIQSSCAVFVAWHPQTGKPRPCAAPFEANDLSPPAPVRYGNARDLFAVPGTTCGVRLDFERGFKHIRLSRSFAVHVAFILDGVGLLPKSVFFGLRDGPLIFCSTLAEDIKRAPTPPPPPSACLSPRIAWVDDITQFGHPPAYVVQVIFAFVKFMAACGWRFGIDKCFILPCILLKFIGILIDPRNTAFRVTPSAALKIALWAVRILQAASADAGQKVTDAQRQLIESHMGRVAWISSTGLHALSYARTLIDTTLSTGRWVEGAKELLIHHATAAGSWPEIIVSALPPKNPLLLSTDASVAPDNSEVTGSGYYAYSDRPPVNFTVSFNRKQLDRFRQPTPSSTWAEAAVATVGAAIANDEIDRNSLPVDGISHVIDSKTVASRAALCSSSSPQCSAFYLLIQQLSHPRPHQITWVSREDDRIIPSDAGSSSASGLWRPLQPVWQSMAAWHPDLDLTADFSSTTAARYSSPHNPSDPKRLANLKALSAAKTDAPSGFLGLTGMTPWSGLRVAGILVPSYAAAIASASQTALSSDNWSALILAELSPDITAMFASWLNAGVSFHASATPCTKLHSVLVAPDGNRPRPAFPTRLILMSKGSGPAPPHVPMPPHWCTASGPLVFDRTLSAEEAFTRWVMSGQCPHPGPPMRPGHHPTHSLLPANAFASAARSAVVLNPPSAPAPAVGGAFAAAARALTDTAASPPPITLPSIPRHPAASATPSGLTPVAPPYLPAPPAAPDTRQLCLHQAAPALPPASATLQRPPPAPQPHHPAPRTAVAAATVCSHRTACATASASPPTIPPPHAADPRPVTLPPLSATLPHVSAASAAATPVPLRPDSSAPPSQRPLARPDPAHPLPAAAGAAVAQVPAPLHAGSAGGSNPSQSSAAASAPSLPVHPATHPTRPVARSARSRRGSVPRRRTWVDSNQQCGQCHRTVLPHQPALLCDNPTCTGWLVCAECLNQSDEDTPLLCPKHQAEKHRRSLLIVAGMTMALAHKPGSVGRVLGVLTAWAGSPKLNQPAIEMAAVLAKAPIILDPTVAMLPEELRLESAKAEQSLWDDDRRKRLRPQAFKMAWLARELAALDAPIQPALIALAKAYVRHRLSPDRPRGWKKAAPEHIASELSGLNRALEDLSYPIAPYLGARRVLEARGAFVKKDHSPRWPIPPFRIFEMADREPRPMTRLRALAVDALVWHAFWGMRPGYLWRVHKSHYPPFKGGFLFRWTYQTKVKRGDREAGKDAPLRIPQITAARHPRLTTIYARCPDSGPMFAEAQDEVPKLVTEWFGEEVANMEDFVLAHAAVRNGLDMAFQVFGVPPDYNDSHMWWARSVPRMRSYYAGLQAAVMFYVN